MPPLPRSGGWDPKGPGQGRRRPEASIRGGASVGKSSGLDVPTRAREGVSRGQDRLSTTAPSAGAEKFFTQPQATLWGAEVAGIFSHSRLLRDSCSGPSVEWKAPEMGAERHLGSCKGEWPVAYQLDYAPRKSPDFSAAAVALTSSLGGFSWVFPNRPMAN